MIATAQLGFWLRRKGYKVGGGLLVTVAVCLVPLLTYSVERMTGLWAAGDPGTYEGFYPRIHASWIVMEIATVMVALVALRFVRFSFLTAPLAFALWFFSMDVASLVLRETYLSGERREWISVIIGLLTIAVGYGLDRSLRAKHESTLKSGTEDYAFWCYLFGMLAFWGGLTMMDSNSEWGRAGYAFINVVLIWLAVKLKRVTFLIFGALGVHIYLGHLAYEVFKDSILFPFALALLGVSLILVTVFAQRRMNRLSQ
ncbi:MAG: hypothetical protein MSG64_11440 [Pyrinomonadaceae bacterium MAG19_C2-C3]|nr:hypothetical protein [Pyrinomonadaceae bacterium MAG19_C2-C3]